MPSVESPIPAPTLDRIEGCLLGLALGDALGAPHEGGPIERLVWRVIGRTGGKLRWTDDTQMSLDLAEALVANGGLEQDDLAARFARSYRWSRGYGPGAAKLLKRIARGADWREANRSVYPDGSFGNGGAMRAPIVGLFFAQRPQALPAAARASAEITHAHPLGIEGAVLVAAATAHAATAQSPPDLLGAIAPYCESTAFAARVQAATRWVINRASPAPGEVRAELGAGIAAADSCVTAIYLAARFLTASFNELQTFVEKLGGDVDTIGAMAGALWGATNGAARLPVQRLEQLERLRATAGELHRSMLR